MLGFPLDVFFCGLNDMFAVWDHGDVVELGRVDEGGGVVCGYVI